MPSLNRTLRQFRKGLAHWLFRNGQRLKVDILPRHFYSSVPDLRVLKRDRGWRGPMTMAGVAGADVAAQLSFVADCCPEALRQRLGAFDVHAHAGRENGETGYGPVEADFLYCFVATRRPRRIVQVGAGVSTAVILRAAEDGGFPVDVTCVDPYPSDYLVRGDRAGKLKLIAERAQDVDLSVLSGVGEGEMLFVDSTHTVKAGSEVNRIILEVLPRLRKGALVHFHDIFFPYDYQRSLFVEPFFSEESTLLHAYLADNARYTIRAALSMLHYAKPMELKELLPRYRPQKNDDGLLVPGDEGHFPSAAYLEVVR
jgi:predicted O-methyltransferase YrrM